MLQKKYSVVVLGNEKLSDGTATIHLQLTPKKTQKYKLAEVWVDSNGKPFQMKVVETNNDSTTVLLTNTKDNITIDKSVWVIDMPQNRKIIKN